jgi:hypothetical protein
VKEQVTLPPRLIGSPHPILCGNDVNLNIVTASKSSQKVGDPLSIFEVPLSPKAQMLPLLGVGISANPKDLHSPPHV